MIEDYRHLFVGRGEEHERAVGVGWIVGRVTRRVEFALLLRCAAIGEAASAVGSGGSGDLVFGFEGILSLEIGKREREVDSMVCGCFQ